MLWFARGSASRRKHFPPPPSPSRSAAATRASRRSKSAGTGERSSLPRLQGQGADRLVTASTLAWVSLVAAPRGHERRAVRGIGPGEGAPRGASGIDAWPAAITLALLLTGEELDFLEKGAGDGEIPRGGRPGGPDVASPTGCALWCARPSIPCQWRAPRRAASGGWRDLREWDPRRGS
jgi:hypothetical protein